MQTLFDFISNVNAVQYGLALLSILGFIIFSEILKPKPFNGLLRAIAEDAGFIKAQGTDKIVELFKNLALAPVYLLFYLAAVPVLFVQGMTQPLGKGISSVTSAGWSPVRAYFAGRRKTRKTKGDDREERSSK